MLILVAFYLGYTKNTAHLCGIRNYFRNLQQLFFAP